MKGEGYLYRPGGGLPEKITFDGGPTLDALKKPLDDAYLQIVPRWTTCDGKPCVAFCDEEGKIKELDYNTRATALWWEALGDDLTGTLVSDYLVGPVLVVTGDEEFMEAL